MIKLNQATEAEENVTEPGNQMTNRAVELNDTTMRLIGIPFFGIIIPNVTGLFGHLTFRDPVYWMGYAYFITLAAFIWQGNRYLLFRTRKRFTWFDKPIEKLVLLFVNNIFYTTPLTIAWLCLWYRWAKFPTVQWDVIQMVTLINVICVLFVTHVYETVFMVKEQENELLRSADLSRAKAEAELAALKNQIDPHFMFNSLNSLSYLIEIDSKRAKLFTENLAEIYRYILAQKDRSLILLEDELAFTNKYVELLSLRFGNALVVNKSFDPEKEKQFLIPPISIFIAIENAVKHNEINAQIPLVVKLDLEGKALIISNEKKYKRSIQHSSGIGLKNLNERFKIILDNQIGIKNESSHFILTLPLTSLS